MDFIVDLIIYAHDGRGLGHVSRSVAIGLAVRRLFPEMSVLLVTGCSVTAELIGDGCLDWIKLPSYKTKISGGKSSGVKGTCGIDDKLLGDLRGQNIRDIIAAYKPKVFLADHTPQGKHKELIPSHGVSPETVRVLGVRAVVGEVDKVWSDFSAEVFRNAYSNILWYGDSKVTGGGEIKRISERYGVVPFVAGYVSRLAELRCLKGELNFADKLAGVISIPWSGAGTAVLLGKLAEALAEVDGVYGKWKIYMDLREPSAEFVAGFFEGLEHVEFSQVGPQFLDDLAGSRCAVIYGGYNSLTDVMAAEVPAIVLLRGMKDGEQEEHAAVLGRKSPSVMDVFSEDGVSVDELKISLQKCLDAKPEASPVNLQGAENAARYLAGLTEQAGVCDADG
ncbi:hypothetical protein [Maridesulfovibrio hydrothermalis]|uniref:Glycosyl transferase family 28 C-terminal domain-containing protein n=1 Tax=Maridesulfovibrio hydrothermalis AM13 = DSM 14728 TaxID=1121451 RepID=L0RGJ6_9BACT|nr:hypothetical protein [Maridesulfovibrio hydrothermalis]CCO24696.1 conserved protein of unknown function [Maridesulfovibrio hydrothermalis AM13 = DSM 14728]